MTFYTESYVCRRKRKICVIQNNHIEYGGLSMAQNGGQISFVIIDETEVIYKTIETILICKVTLCNDWG